MSGWRGEGGLHTCVTSELSILKSLSGWGWTLVEVSWGQNLCRSGDSRIDDLLDRDRS
jgi:hypothetical protein